MPAIRRVLVSVLLFSLPALAGSSEPIKNFHQVNEHLYRGAQPTEAGFKSLAKIGVNTVLDLREHDARSAAEQRLVTALGMHYVNIPMSGLTAPTDEETAEALSLLTDSNNGAVFVHCKRGADRTGAVIAAYRIEHDHWTNVQALKEARELGMSFYQIPRERYILAYHPAEPGTVVAEKHTRTAPVAAVTLPSPAMP